jgi:hypothetical protein
MRVLSHSIVALLLECNGNHKLSSLLMERKGHHCYCVRTFLNLMYKILGEKNCDIL